MELYPVFGGREQYRAAPLDEIERKWLVWQARNKARSKREHEQLKAMVGG